MLTCKTKGLSTKDKIGLASEADIGNWADNEARSQIGA